MHISWAKFLQPFMNHHFQVDRVVDNFVLDQTFELDEANQITREVNDTAKTKLFYAILLRKDESTLDSFVEHLEAVRNHELAAELQQGIRTERLRRERASSSEASTPIPVPQPQRPLTASLTPPAFSFPTPPSPAVTAGQEAKASPAEEVSNLLDGLEQSAQTQLQSQRLNVSGRDALSTISESSLAARRGVQMTPIASKPLFEPMANGKDDQTAKSSTLPKQHLEILGKLLLSQSNNQPSAEQLFDRQHLRRLLFKAFERSCYCNAAITKDALCDRIGNWVSDAAAAIGHAKSPRPATSPTLGVSVGGVHSPHVLTLLVVGPAGTGKHRVIKRMASDVFHCDLYDNLQALLDAYPVVAPSERSSVRSRSEAPSSSSPSPAHYNDTPPPNIAILCTEGYRLAVGHNPGDSVTSNSLATDEGRRLRYVATLAQTQERLVSHVTAFNSQSQLNHHHHQAPLCVISVVFQDLDNLFGDIDPKKATKILAAAKAREGIIPNEANFQVLTPHPGKVFNKTYLDLFCHNGVFVFLPMTKHEELAAVARDLNLVSKALEQQSLNHTYRVLCDFADKLLPTPAQIRAGVRLNDGEDGNVDIDDMVAASLAHKKVKLVRQLMEQLSLISSTTSTTARSTIHPLQAQAPPPRDPNVARMRVQFFQNYTIASTNSSKDDVQLLEELRRLIRSKGPFSRKCYQTMLDMLSNLLTDNADRLQTADFLVKLRLDKVSVVSRQQRRLVWLTRRRPRGSTGGDEQPNQQQESLLFKFAIADDTGAHHVRTYSELVADNSHAHAARSAGANSSRFSSLFATVTPTSLVRLFTSCASGNSAAAQALTDYSR